jgi:hypothetical protein
MLCIFIASREDRLHYTKPPAFWRSELMEKIGNRSPKDFLRVRDVAIQSGLLMHVKGSRTSPGLYWTMVPEWLETKFDAFRKRNGKTAKRSQKGTVKGTANGTAKGTLSITHNPTPIKRVSPESISMKPEGVAVQTWADFIVLRKAKKAPITKTAISRIVNEASKAGWTIEDAISECVTRGWTGFKADWVKSDSKKSASEEWQAL